VDAAVIKTKLSVYDTALKDAQDDLEEEQKNLKASKIEYEMTLAHVKEDASQSQSLPSAKKELSAAQVAKSRTAHRFKADQARVEKLKATEKKGMVESQKADQMMEAARLKMQQADRRLSKIDGELFKARTIEQTAQAMTTKGGIDDQKHPFKFVEAKDNLAMATKNVALEEKSFQAAQLAETKAQSELNRATALHDSVLTERPVDAKALTYAEKDELLDQAKFEASERKVEEAEANLKKIQSRGSVGDSVDDEIDTGLVQSAKLKMQRAEDSYKKAEARVTAAKHRLWKAHDEGVERQGAEQQLKLKEEELDKNIEKDQIDLKKAEDKKAKLLHNVDIESAVVSSLQKDSSPEVRGELRLAEAMDAPQSDGKADELGVWRCGKHEAIAAKMESKAVCPDRLQAGLTEDLFFRASAVSVLTQDCHSKFLAESAHYFGTSLLEMADNMQKCPANGTQPTLYDPIKAALGALNVGAAVNPKLVDEVSDLVKQTRNLVVEQKVKLARQRVTSNVATFHSDEGFTSSIDATATLAKAKAGLPAEKLMQQEELIQEEEGKGSSNQVAAGMFALSSRGLATIGGFSAGLGTVSLMTERSLGESAGAGGSVAFKWVCSSAELHHGEVRLSYSTQYDGLLGMEAIATTPLKGDYRMGETCKAEFIHAATSYYGRALQTYAKHLRARSSGEKLLIGSVDLILKPLKTAVDHSLAKSERRRSEDQTDTEIALASRKYMYKEASSKASILLKKARESKVALKAATLKDAELEKLTNKEYHTYHLAKHNERMSKKVGGEKTTDWDESQLEVVTNIEATAKSLIENVEEEASKKNLGDAVSGRSGSDSRDAELANVSKSRCQSGTGLMANGVFTTSHTPYGRSGLEFNSNLAFAFPLSQPKRPHQKNPDWVCNTDECVTASIYSQSAVKNCIPLVRFSVLSNVQAGSSCEAEFHAMVTRTYGEFVQETGSMMTDCEEFRTVGALYHKAASEISSVINDREKKKEAKEQKMFGMTKLKAATGQMHWRCANESASVSLPESPTDCESLSSMTATSSRVPKDCRAKIIPAVMSTFGDLYTTAARYQGKACKKFKPLPTSWSVATGFKNLAKAYATKRSFLSKTATKAAESAAKENLDAYVKLKSTASTYQNIVALQTAKYEKEARVSKEKAKDQLALLNLAEAAANPPPANSAFGGITTAMKAADAALDAQEAYTSAASKAIKSKAAAARALSNMRRIQRQLVQNQKEVAASREFLTEAQGSVKVAAKAYAKRVKEFYTAKHAADNLGLDETKTLEKSKHWLRFSEAVQNGAIAKQKEAEMEVKTSEATAGKLAEELKKAESAYKGALRISHNDALEAQSKQTSETFAIENRDMAQNAEAEAQKSRLKKVYKDARLAATEAHHTGMALGPLEKNLEATKIQLQEETAAAKKALRRRDELYGKIHVLKKKTGYDYEAKDCR
jgi:hypothetical protein